MAEITPIQFLRGTAAAWTAANPTLAAGKPGFETDTGNLKIGDGATAWNSLAYIGGGGTWGSITGTLSSQTDLQTALDAKVAKLNSATALTDGAAITLTTEKHTLTTDEATITFTDSYTGDFMAVEVTLSSITSAVWTFPAGSLCRFDGASTSDNTMTVTGVSGDKIVLSRWKVGSTYHWVGINNLQ
jgi:hypothetical protein